MKKKQLTCWYAGVANVVECRGAVKPGPEGCDAYCERHNKDAHSRAYASAPQEAGWMAGVRT